MGRDPLDDYLLALAAFVEADYLGGPDLYTKDETVVIVSPMTATFVDRRFKLTLSSAAAVRQSALRRDHRRYISRLRCHLRRVRVRRCLWSHSRSQ